MDVTKRIGKLSLPKSRCQTACPFSCEISSCDKKGNLIGKIGQILFFETSSPLQYPKISFKGNLISDIGLILFFESNSIYSI